jgi:hypothetical protein
MLTMKIEWRTVFKWTLVLIVIGAAALMGRLIQLRLSAQEGHVGGSVPYTVILRETVYHPKGTSHPEGATTAGVDIIMDPENWTGE